MPWQPAHCQAVLRALLASSVALDASEVGVGKTYTTLAAARILEITPLVIGPKGVKHDWANASEAMGVPIEFVNYEKARGVSKRFHWHNPEIFGPAFRNFCGSDYGYEKPHGSGSMWVWADKRAMIIFDEAQKCGGSTSVQGKMLRSSRNGAEFVLALSASLADSVLQMKNIGLALGLFTNDTYKNWLFKHGCKPGVFGGFALKDDPAIQEKAMAAVHASIFPKKGARMRRSEIPNFPLSQIDFRLIDEPAAVPLMTQLDELSENDPGGTRLRMALEKLLTPHLAEFAEAYHDPDKCRVAIFTNYIDTIDSVKKQISKELKVGIIDGRQTGVKGEQDRKATKEAFQGNTLDVVIVNIAAGGAGLSLHDPTGVIERAVAVCPCGSGRTLKQVLGRCQRAKGAFSRQFIFGFKNTSHEELMKTARQRLRNIDMLNDAELDELNRF